VSRGSSGGSTSDRPAFVTTIATSALATSDESLGELAGQNCKLSERESTKGPKSVCSLAALMPYAIQRGHGAGAIPMLPAGIVAMRAFRPYSCLILPTRPRAVSEQRRFSRRLLWAAATRAGPSSQR